MKSLFSLFERAYVDICEYYCSGNFCMIGVHSILFVRYFFIIFLRSVELLLWFSDVIYSFVDLLTLKYVLLVASTECGIFLRCLQHF